MTSVRLPKFLETDEVRALLSEPNRRYPTGLRNYVIMSVMYHAGLRVSEVVDLEVTHVQSKSNIIRVVGGKGDKDRNIPVEPWLIDAIASWQVIRANILAKHPKAPANLFLNLKGTALQQGYLREMVAREADHAGIAAHVTPHMLRHTYATKLLNDGFTISEVQRLLGHKHLSTTQVYLHVNDTHLSEKIAKRNTRLA